MTTQLKEQDVELAERYASALQKIEDADAFTESQVELAERYAAALKQIEESDADVDTEPTRVVIHLDDRGRIADVSASEPVAVLINPVGTDFTFTKEGDHAALAVGQWQWFRAAEDFTGYDDRPTATDVTITADEYDRAVQRRK